MSRSTALKMAASLSFLMGIYSIIFSIPYLQRGEADIEQAGDASPYFVVVAGFVLAIVMLTAAYGTWHKQRWGIVLTLLANTLGALLAVPGIFFAPTESGQVSAGVGVLGSIIVCILCLWRDRKPITV
jgi:uncharacterized membrane protein (DUF2068 family)